MTLAEALKELGNRRLLAPDKILPQHPAFLPYSLDRNVLRRKVQITAEGIALPNGQLLYGFADSEPGGKTR